MRHGSRIAAALGLALVLGVAFSEAGDAYRGFFDLRAALLVFVAPLLVLGVFRRGELGLGSLPARLRLLRRAPLPELARELRRETAAARGPYGFSHVARWSEAHADPFVRHAGELFGTRYGTDALARLLVQRTLAEDAQWQGLAGALAFLAKMAPYFGMLATVIGMIQLLHGMSDFTKISGSMALAMQGTLYGLLSFTLLYSPLQRWFGLCREEWLQRHELVARWFTLVSEQAEPALIAGELGSLLPSAALPEAGRGAAAAVPAAAGGAP